MSAKLTQRQWQAKKRAWGQAQRIKDAEPVKGPKDHGNHAVDIRPGKGPHAGEIYCQVCQCHISWLSQTDYLVLIND